MVFIFHLANAIVVCFSLIISSYALPPPSKLGSSSSVADRVIVPSSSLILDDLKLNGSGSIYNSSTEVLNTPLGPEWPIYCSTHREPLTKANCYHIATQIENSPGATTFRIYRSDDPPMAWAYGNCQVVVGSNIPGATDVFQPVLIARDIRRVVQLCDITVPGQSGITAIGPRGKLRLEVEKPILRL